MTSIHISMCVQLSGLKILVYACLGCGPYQICSNDDHRLTLTYFTSRSNLLSNALKLEILGKVLEN